MKSDIHLVIALTLYEFMNKVPAFFELAAWILFFILTPSWGYFSLIVFLVFSFYRWLPHNLRVIDSMMEDITKQIDMAIVQYQYRPK